MFRNTTHSGKGNARPSLARKAQRRLSEYMWNILLVLAGGAVGSLARYGLAALTRQIWPVAEWPVGTFIANVTGGVAMGVLMGLLLGPLKGVVDTERLRLLLGVGLLGGYTTFSSFSLETVFMLERRHYLMAMAYAVTSVVLAVGGVALGLWLVRRVVPA